MINIRIALCVCVRDREKKCFFDGSIPESKSQVPPYARSGQDVVVSPRFFFSFSSPPSLDSFNLRKVAGGRRKRLLL